MLRERKGIICPLGALKGLTEGQRDLDGVEEALWVVSGEGGRWASLWEETGQPSRLSKAQPPHIPLLPREKELHPALALQMGLWSWPSLTPGWGEAEETGDNPVFPIATKICPLRGALGSTPYASSAHGRTSTPLTRVRRCACHPACCCAEPRAEHNILKRCWGQQCSPLPRSPSLQGGTTVTEAQILHRS